MGRLREAGRLAEELDEHVRGLTAHHRLHGVACKLEVEELRGDWDAILALEGETEQIVGDNRDTPCVRNARSLLLCALSRQLRGDTDRSRELEARADELQNEGYGATLATPRVRIAIARGELDPLASFLAEEDWLQRQTWFSLPAAAARLDVLAIAGSASDVEATAQRVDRPRSYLEPFATRARGIVRDDETLLFQAQRQFGALRLDWHAQQTETLRRFRKLAAG